jgi:pimeloyl-ACP methyl ester carboxylesterase
MAPPARLARRRPGEEVMQINGSMTRELAVEIEGDGPPVLMVHGLGGTSAPRTPTSPTRK